MTAQNDIHDDWNKTYSFEYSIKYLWPTKHIYRFTREKNRNYTRFDVFNTPTEILPECHSSSFVDNKYFRPFKPQVTLHNLDVESDIMFIRTTSLCLLNFFLLQCDLLFNFYTSFRTKEYYDKWRIYLGYLVHFIFADIFVGKNILSHILWKFLA